MSDSNQYPECMEYIGNNQYRCTKNKIPIITVKPENLPIRCAICEKSSYPSLLKQATNFTSSMYNYAKSGFRNVSPEEYRERLGACQKCEFYDKGRCQICGCFMTVKAWLASEECPKNLWPIIKKEGNERKEGEEKNN